MLGKKTSYSVENRSQDVNATGTVRARSIGLIRKRRTPPFSDDAFDPAHLNPDESSELIQLIRKNYG